MPFFLAVASPAFGGSALTTCGRAGATGATNAVVLESIISGRSRQRMIYHKRIEGCRSVQKSSKIASVARKASPVALTAGRACLASVLHR